MAEQLSKVASKMEPLPKARVVYDAEQDVLLIESGEKSEVGEEMAESIVVHYNKDDESVPADEAVRAVAIFIDGAQYALKPFVDAILEKHGMNSAASQNGTEANRACKKSAYSQSAQT